MLPAGEPNPKNGVNSSSSSTSSSRIANPLPPLPPRPPQADRNTSNQLENRAAIDIHETELVCDESFSEIIKKEEGGVVTLSDAYSTSIVFPLNKRKRLLSPNIDKEEDGNATVTVSDVNKLPRIDEADKEEERKEQDGLNGNQESELDDDEEEEEGGNQENNNGEEDENKETEEEKEDDEEGKIEDEKEDDEDGKTEDEKEDDADWKTEEEEEQETEEEAEGKKEELDEGKQEKPGKDQLGERDEDQNGGGKVKRPLSELYDSNILQCSTAEEHEEHGENALVEITVNHQNSEQNAGLKDGENDENPEEKRKAAEKGKRPMSEICKLESIAPKFSKFEKGGPSDTPEGNQTPDIDDEIELIDRQDLVILKSLWHFHSNNGYIPFPHCDKLHNHIMDSIPNLKILGEDLTKNIIAFRDNFKTVRKLNGDNPKMARPVDQETFDLSMRIWGNVDDDIGNILNGIAYGDANLVLGLSLG